MGTAEFLTATAITAGWLLPILLVLLWHVPPASDDDLHESDRRRRR